MTLAERTAEVHWEGTLARGEGEVLGGSGASLPLDWASSSEGADGKTSPEELLAASHASCYAQALALMLTREGTPPERLDVRAKCSLEERGEWFEITTVDLEVRGAVPDLDEEAFERAAERADRRCPVSNALRAGVEIRLNASLGAAAG